MSTHMFLIGKQLGNELHILAKHRFHLILLLDHRFLQSLLKYGLQLDQRLLQLKILFIQR